MFIPIKELIKSKRVQGLLILGAATIAQKVFKLPVQESDVQAIIQHGSDAVQALGAIWFTFGAIVAQKPLVK